MKAWIYKNEPLTKIPQDGKYYGFVYLITNDLTGAKYIGKKLFYFSKTKQVNKKRRKYKAESDWLSYWGSNARLTEDIEKNGVENFSREILYLCTSKSECSYLEAKTQFEHDAILREDYYNDWMSMKITRRHMQNVNRKNIANHHE